MIKINKTKFLNSYFLSQPHQPFFVFGVLWSIVLMLVFGLSHNGLITLDVSENIFHLYGLIFIVFSQFFYGFLFTTLPRFCGSVPIPKSGYLRAILLYQVGAILFLIGSLISWKIAISGMILIVLANALSVFALYLVYKIGTSLTKEDPFWLLIAQYIGLGSHLAILSLFFLNHMDITFDIKPFVLMSFYPYIIFTAFVIAQRMIPFFSHSLMDKPRYFIEIVFVLFLLKTVFMIFDLLILDSIVSIALGVFLLKVIITWELSTTKAPAIVWVLHLALYWLPLALLMGAASSIYKYFYHTDMLFLEIHLLALGFLTTVLIGFGTRVALGHSGRTIHADKVTIYIFLLTQIVVLTRFLLSIAVEYQELHLLLFNVTVVLWVIVFALWSKKYIKILSHKKITFSLFRN